MPIPNEPVAIQKLYTSRNNNANAETFVGEVQRLWYNPDTNCLYVSDGTTPGGIPLNACGNVNANITVKDEGVTLTSNVSSLDFVGAGVTATAVGRAVTINIPAVAPSVLASYDEGNLLTANTVSYNFVGEGVVANATANAVTVTVGAGIAALYSGSFYFDSSTTLTNNINSNTTAPILVGSTTGFSASGYIRIESELIRYTGKTATSFTGITRGVGGSQQSTHDAGVGISQAQVTAAGVPIQVQIDATSISNNVTLDSATGNVTIGGAGTYNLQFSVQTENFGNEFGDTAVWFRVNGTDVPVSSSYCSVPYSHAGVPGSNIMTVNIFYTLAAGDVVALWWTSLTGTTAITSIPPVGSTIPQSPAVIFTVNRIY